MIQTFACKQTEAIFRRRNSKLMAGTLYRVAYRKLVMLHSAATIQDLRVPPGNRLEVLKGDRKGQHSIRINERWRVCFVWLDRNAYDVEIVDYH